MKSVIIWLWLLPRNLAIGFMNVYRKLISPLYGEVCRYYPSCSRYALDSFKQVGFVKGTLVSTWRLLRCNPWSDGGIDDPPTAKNKNYVETKYGFIMEITGDKS